MHCFVLYSTVQVLVLCFVYMLLQGAVWVMEFSICGRLLATAGQDSVVVSERILITSLLCHHIKLLTLYLNAY